MRRGRGFAIALALLAAAALLYASAAFAAWPATPYIDVDVCSAGGHQVYQVIAPDGAGGAYIAWADFRSANLDVYAMRLGPDGAPVAGWPVNGKPIATGPATQIYPAICEDGSGGAYILWADSSSSATNYDLRVLRVDGTGSPRPGWSVAGLVIANSNRAEINPRIAYDGAGGAFVAWEQVISSSNHDIRAMRVFGNATTGSNLAVCTHTSMQRDIVLEPDGIGGWLLAWEDDRNAPLLAGWDIYAAHVNSVGGLDWSSNGVSVTSAFANQLAPTIVADGTGGLLAFWEDLRTANKEIYARRIGPTGAALWPEKLISTAPSFQYSPMAVSDGGGGAYVVWTRNVHAYNQDIYAQRIRPNGAVMWSANGVGICTEGASQLLRTVIADGENGMVAVWQDDRDGIDDDLYAQRVGPAGANGLWTFNGVQVSATPAAFGDVAVVADGRNGFIASWDGVAVGATELDIQAKRFDAFGFVGQLAPTLVSVTDVPNDQGGQVKVSWERSALDIGPYYDVEAYWVWRSVPPQAALAALRTGAARLIEEGMGDHSPPSGIRRFTRTTAAGATTHWEHVATQAASGDPGYSRVIATESDSVAGSNPLTLFRVQGRHENGTAFWNSEAAGGYSVDNLAPPAPASFAAVYGSQSTALHWGLAAAPDLRGYRIYAGPAPDFSPGPETFVAEVSDTGYVDPAPAPLHYRLTAVDAHGNESPAVLASPPGNVSSGPVSGSFRFAPPIPNPFREEVALQWTLAGRAHVRVTIFDAAGRAVAPLVNARFEPGTHAARWDGRDATGHAVPPGLYFARLQTEGSVAVRRILRVQ